MRLRVYDVLIFYQQRCARVRHRNARPDLFMRCAQHSDFDMLTLFDIAMFCRVPRHMFFHALYTKLTYAQNLSCRS